MTTCWPVNPQSKLTGVVVMSRSDVLASLPLLTRSAERQPLALGMNPVNSSNIQNIANAMAPDTPQNEHSLWCQGFFHGERGRNGLARDRRARCKLQ